jgi:hypothetical protein
VEFLAEQDGAPEQELKAALRPILAGSRVVERAYLARVGFQPHVATAVALCLTGPSDVPGGLLKELMNAFATLFRSDAALDIVAVSAEQEADLRRVCLPFYERAV